MPGTNGVEFLEPVKNLFFHSELQKNHNNLRKQQMQLGMLKSILIQID